MTEKNIVYFEIDSGRALIMLENNEMYLLHIKSDGHIVGPRKTSEDFNINTWISLANSRIVDIDIGTFPFEPLSDYLLFEKSVHELENWFRRILNPNLPPAFRRRAAVHFNMHYRSATNEARNKFQRLMIETPLWNDLDTKNAPLDKGSPGAKLLEEILTRRRP